MKSKPTLAASIVLLLVAVSTGATPLPPIGTPTEALDPWVDEAGDNMTGTLRMNDQEVVFTNGPLNGTVPGGGLLFGGARICTAGLDWAGCGDIEAVSPGFGLLGGATSGPASLAVDEDAIQRRITATCSGSSAISAIHANGTVQCVSDTGSILWSRLVDFPTGCSIGQFVQALGASLTCAAPPGDNTGGWTDDAAVVRLTDGSDRVGIGTSNPTEKLELAYAFPATALKVGQARFGQSGGIGFVDAYADVTANAVARDANTWVADNPGRPAWIMRLDAEGGSADADSVFFSYSPPGNPLSPARKMTLTGAGNLGIGVAAPQSALHVPDGRYAQLEDHNAGAPPTADCDTDAERGRISLDTSNQRLYVCNGTARGWDWMALND